MSLATSKGLKPVLNLLSLAAHDLTFFFVPKLTHLIVACSANRVIGRAGSLPWSIPEDTQFFKRKTLGHTVILGRDSWQDWPDAGHGRDVVLLTSRPALPHKSESAEAAGQFRCAGSLSEAIEVAQSYQGDIYLCGGQRVYEEGLPLATGSLFLTLIYAHVDGDRYFPDWRGQFSREISRKESCHEAWRYAFLELGR
ncbi:MAG TPA: dihydrofolate reductase [Opitutaceae bacterium]|nr:dihydrofolate reductase [Opitutaceae bacterium]